MRDQMKKNCHISSDENHTEVKESWLSISYKIHVSRTSILNKIKPNRCISMCISILDMNLDSFMMSRVNHSLILNFVQLTAFDV